MFGFLKEKLKSAISIFSKKASAEDHKEKKEVKPVKKEEVKKKEIKPQIKEKKIPEEIKESQILESEKEIITEEKELETEIKEPEPTEIEQEVKSIVKEEEQKLLEEERIVQEQKEKEIIEQEHEEKKGFFSFFKRKKEPEQEKVEPIKEEEPEKKGFFSKITESITTKKIDSDEFEELFYDLELALLENNVAVEVIDKIKEDLKTSLVDKPLSRTKIEDIILKTLKDSINEILSFEKIDFLKKVKSKKPFVICFVGINGSGKTTSIAKIVKMLQNNNLTSVIAAADTFRAAAIDQLQHHADALKVKLIKQDYGSDPAAVAFDAIKHAQAKNIDIVLIDTAGRMHSNVNLVDEMKKIIRVAKPDLKIFVGESITGNDCIEQAKEFNEAIGIDGIILSKADVDEKGGAALSVSYITKKPIIFIGTGQEYTDLKEFSPSLVLENLGL
jgi:fused signal recognition particle receptor